MCGRYVSPDTAAIEREWRITRRTSNPFPRHYNVAPSSQIQIIRCTTKGEVRELTEARWGFVRLDDPRGRGWTLSSGMPGRWAGLESNQRPRDYESPALTS
jgi:SOS response associated peptidase (SRAP)